MLTDHEFDVSRREIAIRTPEKGVSGDSVQGGIVMRVADSSISMSSMRAYQEQREVSERLRIWAGKERPDFEGRGRVAPQPSEPMSAANKTGYLLELIHDYQIEAKKSVAPKPKGDISSATMGPGDVVKISSKEELKIAIIEKMLQALTGKIVKIKIFSMAEGCENGNCEQPRKSKEFDEESAAGQPLQGWGVEYDYHESYREHEKLMFKAEGLVRTADGQEIRFDVKLKMRRTFAESHDISVRAGDAVMKDPLVINYSGSELSLTKTKFRFDLDLDGVEDMISFVNEGSGFLALDVNGDGVINSGSELFGPATGSGFAELSRYDQDGNDLLDENDPVFDKLRIWSKDSQGSDSLFTLTQKNVGAIYLANIGTLFKLKDSANQLHGQVVSSSVYLRENGTAGTVQQVDLAV